MLHKSLKKGRQYKVRLVVTRNEIEMNQLINKLLVLRSMFADYTQKRRWKELDKTNAIGDTKPKVLTTILS